MNMRFLESVRESMREGKLVHPAWEAALAAKDAGKTDEEVAAIFEMTSALTPESVQINP